MFAEYWNESTLQTKLQGKRWYARARQECAAIAQDARVAEITAAGVVAALSPRTHWSENVRAARRLLVDGRDPGCLKGNARKAREIASGRDPLQVLSGPKVRAFFRAIMGQRHVVVVDSWMLRVAGHHSDKCTPLQYKRIAERIAAEAREVGVWPSEFQAVVWCQVRGTSS